MERHSSGSQGAPKLERQVDAMPSAIVRKHQSGWQCHQAGASQRRRCWSTDLKGEEDLVRCKRTLGARREIPGRGNSIYKGKGA